MAAKEEEFVSKLRNEVEKLRKTDAEVGKIGKRNDILSEVICRIIV